MRNGKVWKICGIMFQVFMQDKSLKILNMSSFIFMFHAAQSALIASSSIHYMVKYTVSNVELWTWLLTLVIISWVLASKFFYSVGLSFYICTAGITVTTLFSRSTDLILTWFLQIKSEDPEIVNDLLSIFLSMLKI